MSTQTLTLEHVNDKIESWCRENKGYVPAVIYVPQRLIEGVKKSWRLVRVQGGSTFSVTFTKCEEKTVEFMGRNELKGEHG